MGKTDRKGEKNSSAKGFSRRDFLKITGGVVVGSNLSLGDPFIQRSLGQEKVQEVIPPIEVLYPDTAGPETARIVSEAWEKLGLKINPVIQPSHSLVPRAYNRDYQHIVYCYWSSMPERLDPGYWISEFYHSRNAEKGKRNWGNYVNLKADELIDQQEFELDREKRRDLIWRAQALVAKDHPIIISCCSLPSWTTRL